MTTPAQPAAALASVVLPCSGPLAELRESLAHLARHTRPPWELLAVADPADAGVAAEVGAFAATTGVPARPVARPGGAGLLGGFLAGLAAARGGHVAFLTPGTLVTDAWLDQLVALLASVPGQGAAAPMSDAAPPPQYLAAPAGGVEALASHAARHRTAWRGRWSSPHTLGGPCLVARRDALPDASAVPPDGDPIAALAAAVRAAGAGLAVAHDLFVLGGGGSRADRDPATDAPGGPRTRVVALPRAEFARRFGEVDAGRALCGYTPPGDTAIVLSLLMHSKARRILEIGTALGHMTANLTEWSPDDARVVSVGCVDGDDRGAPPEQGVEAPRRGDLGRYVDHFGKGRKAEVVAANTRDLDASKLGIFDFAFVDGGHGLDQVLRDSRMAYEALTPGGWLVWHDVGHPEPWVRVADAVELAGFGEPVEHVEGTMVAFLRKAGPARPPAHLTWEGDVDGIHSLGLINRRLCLALVARGVDLGLAARGAGEVAPERLPPEPALEARRGARPAPGAGHVWVAHRWPPRLDRPPAGRWAFYQPWEFGSLPVAWRDAAARADEVWAYSRSVRDAYVDAGIPPDRVHVIPLGVDPGTFGPGAVPFEMAPGPSFRFLFVGGTIWRKGIDLLLEAYARAFASGDGVGLVIQDMGSRSFYRGQTAGAAIAALRARGYPIEHREDPLGPEGLARLYASCDCAVQPYRGEGFALPVLEAMACGRPVIVTGAGPALDYADGSTADLVPARRVELPGNRVGDIETVGTPWVWEPDLDALVDALRGAVADPARGLARGEAAARAVRSGWTWAHAADAVAARLDALAAAAPDTPRVATTARVEAGTPHPMLLGARDRPRVSLTMIVRDEERNLPHCLGSARGLFDEIVVLDTGSRDRTADIARSFGARVCDFIWVDDFAAARNAALARATGDYAFWLDADDVLEPPAREALATLLAGLQHGDEAAYVVRCACDPDREGGGGETVVDHIRLFPAREDVRWTYRVHEQILPALRHAGVPVRWTGVTVRHTGYADAPLRRRKLARDEAILLAEAEERPGDPFILFNLGSIAIERCEWDAALARLEGSLAASAPGDSITRKLYSLIARCHQMRGEADRALGACEAGLRIDPEDAELLFREAVLRRQGGDSAGAERCWSKVLTLRRPERFASLDPGIYGHLTRRNLATLRAERGDLPGALRLWGEVLVECPGDAEASREVGRLEGRPAGCRP